MAVLTLFTQHNSRNIWTSKQVVISKICRH